MELRVFENRACAAVDWCHSFTWRYTGPANSISVNATAWSQQPSVAACECVRAVSTSICYTSCKHDESDHLSLR